MASAIIFSFFLLRFLRLQPVLWLFFLLAPFAITLSALLLFLPAEGARGNQALRGGAEGRGIVSKITHVWPIM